MILNLFKKQNLPEKIPKGLAKKIKEFSTSRNKEYFLKKSFFYIVNTWGGGRFGFITNFFRLINNDIYKLFNKTGCLHCTSINYVLRITAIKSGLFNEEDIELKLTHTWFIIPHQYLRFNLGGGSFVDIDLWNYQFGIDYGSYGSGFDFVKIKPIR